MRQPRQHNGLRFFLGLLVTLALLVLLGGLLNWVVMPFLTHRGAEVVVPDVTGLLQSDGEARLARVSLRIGVVRAVQNPATAGTIVAQYPRAGRRTRHGRSVDLDVSGGSFSAKIPAVEGLPTANAILAIEQNGLVVTRIESLRTPRIPADQVVAVNPPAGTEVGPGTQVVLSISTRIGMFPMPNVVGMNSETARGIIASQGLLLGTVRTAVSSEPAGTVLFQYPEEGMPVVEGDTVTVIVAGTVPGRNE